MLSISRYDVRRNYIGAVRRGCSTRTKGHFSVREELPEYKVTPTCVVACDIPSRIPRYRCLRDIKGVYSGLQQLVTVAWMNPMQGFILKDGHVCASNGAEKSFLTRRRKRGLRKGKRRSRGRHPRRSVPDRQSLPKTPSARVVNHSGRKFLWAMRASSDLLKDVKKYHKFPSNSDNPRIRAVRKSMKQYLLVKWTRLHNRAVESSIPDVSSFHRSLWKFMAVNNPKVDRNAWDDLLSAVEPADTPRGPRRFDSKGFLTVNRRGWADSLPRKKVRGP